MKKFLALFFVLLMTLSLCSCGSGSTKAGDGSTLLFDYADLSKLVKVPDYKEFKFDSMDEDFTDLLADTMVEDMDGKNLGEEAEIASGTVQDGDTVHIVYVGKHNGTAFNGGSTGDSGTDLKIGSGSYIDGFEEGLIGVAVGETKVLNLTFPDPYPNDPTLAGEKVEFTVTVESIKRTTYPELTDDVAKQLGFNSLSDYNMDVFSRAAQSYLIQKLFDGTEVIKVPEKELEYYVDSDIKYYTQYASAYGTDIETMTGMTVEELRSQFEKTHRAYMNQYMSIYCVAKAEKLTVKAEDIDAKIAEMISDYGISEEEFMKTATREQIEYAMLYDNVQKYLYNMHPGA